MDAVWGKFGKDSGTNNFLYGMASVAAYCKMKGFINIKFIDPNIECISKEKYASFLKDNKFDVVAFSSFTASITYTLETIRLVKKTLPGCIIVLGGIHASLLPEETMQECKELDFVAIGEGEITFNELLESIISDKQYGNIDGIMWRKDGKIARNKPRQLVSDINMLPMPLYDLFPMEKYQAQATHSKVFPTYTMLVSRGCCFNCAFCNATDIHGRKVRYKSISLIMEEIKYLKEKFGARGITFYDSTFTANKNWVREFCNELIRQGIKITWDCSTRTDTIDEDLLKLMKMAGCWSVSFGIESGNQKSLNLIRKNNTVETNTKGVKLANRLGFFVATNYIIGIPGEDYSDAMNTIKYAKKLGAHQALFYLPIPYPKTPLYDICKAENTINPNATWKDYNALDFDNPIYINPKIGKKKMKELYNYAFKTYYRTPMVLLRNIAQLNSVDAFKKYLMAVNCYFKFQ